MTQLTSYETKLGSMEFDQLPFHWVWDNRHCTLGDVSGQAFSFLCQGTVLHRKDCRKQRAGVLFYMACEEKASWSQKLAMLSKQRLMYLLQGSRLIRHLVLDYGILHETKRPRAAVAPAQLSPQKHMCCQGHGALKHSSCPSSGWLHTPFPS